MGMFTGTERQTREYDFLYLVCEKKLSRIISNKLSTRRIDKRVLIIERKIDGYCTNSSGYLLILSISTLLLNLGCR